MSLELDRHALRLKNVTERPPWMSTRASARTLADSSSIVTIGYESLKAALGLGTGYALDALGIKPPAGCATPAS